MENRPASPMIVPAYWAEARLQSRAGKRRVTVRRFGWSDEGQAAAEAHAQARAQAALDRILAGETLPRRERRSNYGVHGVPIREQIVARHPDGAIVTRNSYGARCLNSPDVLFADIDFAPRRFGPPTAVVAIAMALGLAAGVWFQHWIWPLGTAVVVLPLAIWLGERARRRHMHEGGAEARALQRVEAFSTAHPDWHLRVYRSPGGLRAMALHRTFDPLDAEVAACFQALGTDPLYAMLCKAQRCFRARLTAKPWRAGVRRRIRPPVAAWSPEQANRPDRLAWIDRYERAASRFAACRFLRALGDTTRIDPVADRIRALHDEETGALTARPLA
ncbi:hypothetical protein LDO32_11905 [Luteimonas sp. Y-2-2-4F]|nr:hypothetical protein [Luteimonas sp. Y-2-2-4F]MCD9032430.1 hypothetical protein [Luteimonas sp. Y-2-2-4F]